MLANNGKALDESNTADTSVKQRLDYALKYVMPSARLTASDL